MTFCIFKLLLSPLLLLCNIQGQKARGCLAQTTISCWKFCLPVLLGYHNISNQSPREPQSPQEQNGQKELLSFSQLLLKMIKAEYGKRRQEASLTAVREGAFHGADRFTSRSTSPLAPALL